MCVMFNINVNYIVYHSYLLAIAQNIIIQHIIIASTDYQTPLRHGFRQANKDKKAHLEGIVIWIWNSRIIILNIHGITFSNPNKSNSLL